MICDTRRGVQWLMGSSSRSPWGSQTVDGLQALPEIRIPGVGTKTDSVASQEIAKFVDDTILGTESTALFQVDDCVIIFQLQIGPQGDVDDGAGDRETRIGFWDRDGAGLNVVTGYSQRAGRDVSIDRAPFRACNRGKLLNQFEDL